MYRRTAHIARKEIAAGRAKVGWSRAKVTGRIERLIDMMADGIGDYAEMKPRLATALAERAESRQLEDAAVAPAIAPHPNLAEACRRNVEKLTEALNAPELKAGEAHSALRNLTKLITAEPGIEGRGLVLLVHGRLAQILHIADDRPDVSQDGRMRNVVAGAAAVLTLPQALPRGIVSSRWLRRRIWPRTTEGARKAPTV